MKIVACLALVTLIGTNVNAFLPAMTSRSFIGATTAPSKVLSTFSCWIYHTLIIRSSAHALVLQCPEYWRIVPFIANLVLSCF